MLVGLGVTIGATVGIKVGIGVDVESFFNLASIPASIVAFMFWIGVGIGLDWRYRLEAQIEGLNWSLDWSPKSDIF